MRAFSTRLKHAHVELVNNFGLKLELLSNAILPIIIFQALLCNAQIYRTHSLPQVIGTFSDVQFSQLVRGSRGMALVSVAQRCPGPDLEQHEPQGIIVVGPLVTRIRPSILWMQLLLGALEPDKLAILAPAILPTVVESNHIRLSQIQCRPIPRRF